MGRKRIEIDIPSSPFTTRDLENKYPGLSFNFFHVRLRELMDRGEVKIIGKRRPPGKGKGKAWSLYLKTLQEGRQAQLLEARTQIHFAPH